MTRAMDDAPTLEREPWEAGWQVRFAARGWLRLVPAAFLSVWLAGWLFGEVFVGRVLLATSASVFGLEPPPGLGLGGSPPPPGMAGFMIAFMAVWLAFWTFGGVMAMRALVLLIVGREEVRWDDARIEAASGFGPFMHVKRVRGEDLRRIRVRSGRLEADTRHGRVVLDTFGSRAEREALCAALRRSLAGWLEGERRWSRDGEPFRAGFWREAPATGGPALVSGGRWLGERLEPAPGQLTRRTRIGPWERVRAWQPLALTLQMERDSDGDEHWALLASGPQGEETLHSSLEDPAPAHALGEWLSRHTGAVVRELRTALGKRRAA